MGDFPFTIQVRCVLPGYIKVDPGVGDLRASHVENPRWIAL